MGQSDACLNLLKWKIRNIFICVYEIPDEMLPQAIRQYSKSRGLLHAIVGIYLWTLKKSG